MKTCFSDFGKYNYITNNYKLCPFSCCSCYIIECCCCCHCSCHLKSEKVINYPQPLTYSLITTTTDYNTQNKIIPIKQLENNKNNIENNNNNKNTNKVAMLTKYSSLKNSNKSKNKLILNNDILNETKNIKNEINDLKEKLKIEKENLSKILKNDFNIINERIKMKKNEIYKKEDINRNINQNNIRNNNINKPKELKRIYLPQNFDNIIKRKSHNVLLNNEYAHNKLSNKKSYNIDTNIDFINNKIKYNRQKNYLNHNNNNKIKELEINIKNFNHKSPNLYSKEQYKRVKTAYYPINNTESSCISFRKNYSSPYRGNDNYNVHSHVHKNKRNNQILNNKYNFTTSFSPKNLNNENTSYLTDIPNSSTQLTETSLFNNLNDINYKNKIDKIKSKNQICYNDNIPKLLYKTRRQNSTNSYENIKDIHKIKMSPLHKCGHAVLSHRNFNYNLKDNNTYNTHNYKIGKDNFYNKYNMNKYIRYKDIKKIPFFPSIKTNRQNQKIISLPKDNYILKSKSNEDIYKKNENKIKINNKNFLYSKKNLNNLNFSKIKTNKIQSIEINKNIINKKRVLNKHNINVNKIKDMKEKNSSTAKSRNEKNKISTDRPNLMIDNQSFSINKFNNKINNIEFKNLNKYSSVPFLKKNKYLSFTKKRKTININDKYELLKYNKTYINNANSKDEDNIGTVYSITNYISENNCDIVKSEENKPINTNNLLKRDNNNNNKSNLLSKMHIDSNLSVDDEMDNYYKLKLNTNIEISSKTIFTIYNISNKLFILCFDFINKKFSLRDFADYGKFEENYKLSLQTKVNVNNENKLTDGNLFLSKGEYLYIITGKNHDMLYVYDSVKRTMNKLCNLNNNHSNGALIDFNNNSLLCISGDFNKKVELFSITKNEWNDYLSETLIERSNYAFCLIKNRYIFLLFGKNYPTNEYLNTIEYYDLNNNNSNGWKYLNFKNQNNLIKMNICNGIGINYEDKKIIVVGGYNGLEKKDEQYFVQLVLDDEDNFENSKSYVEMSERKLKDIDKNKKYYFHGGEIISVENKDEQKNNILYFISIDNHFNCHTIQLSNLAHDVYYNC